MSKNNSYLGVVNRSDFVKTRYENFLANKKTLESYPPEIRKMIITSDLDQTETHKGVTKVLRDVVLCDRCNEDITEVSFMGRIAEGQLYFVYHRLCLDKKELDELKLPDNVIDLSKVKL